MHPRRKRAAVTTSLTALLTSAAVASITLDAPAFVRIPCVLAFVGLAPGVAILSVIQLPSAAVNALLVIPVSLIVQTAIATIVLYAGLWSPTLVLGSTVVVVGAASLASLWTARVL